MYCHTKAGTAVVLDYLGAGHRISSLSLRTHCGVGGSMIDNSPATIVQIPLAFHLLHMQQLLAGAAICGMLSDFARSGANPSIDSPGELDK